MRKADLCENGLVHGVQHLNVMTCIMVAAIFKWLGISVSHGSFFFSIKHPHQCNQFSQTSICMQNCYVRVLSLKLCFSLKCKIITNIKAYCSVCEANLFAGIGLYLPTHMSMHHFT